MSLRRPILHGQVNFPLCLAPMVGLSHWALRSLCQTYMPEGALTIWPTEMLNSRRLPQEKLGETPETLRGPHEIFLVPQILANEEGPIEASLKKLETWGAAAIDINMGCPVQKALRHNYGVALMGDADYAAQVVALTVKHSAGPVSVKLRAGLQNDFTYLRNFALGLQKSGAAWLCLHPRTSDQKRRGRADWSQIQSLREQLDIPLIGNGDVQNLTSILRMLKETSCDSVMVGRAFTAKPWLCWSLGRALGFSDPTFFGERPVVFGDWPKNPPSNPEEEALEYGFACWWMLKKCFQIFGAHLGLRKFRYYIKVSSVWLDFGHHLFSLSTSTDSEEHLEQALLQFFCQRLRLAEATELRE